MSPFFKKWSGNDFTKSHPQLFLLNFYRILLRAKALYIGRLIYTIGKISKFFRDKRIKFQKINPFPSPQNPRNPNPSIPTAFARTVSKNWSLAAPRTATSESMTNSFQKCRQLSSTKTVTGSWRTVAMARRAPMAPGSTSIRSRLFRTEWYSSRIRLSLLLTLFEQERGMNSLKLGSSYKRIVGSDLFKWIFTQLKNSNINNK